MKQTTLTVLIVSVLGFTSCDRNSSSPKTSTTQSPDKTSKKMNNLVSIVEIPTDSIQRATRFYQLILNLSIDVIDMQGIQMGIFQSEEGSVNVALVQGAGYRPSGQGTLAYLNAGDDLQNVLDKIEVNGGKIVMPKTEIDPENGFFATFIDSEGNRMGLHSFK